MDSFQSSMNEYKKQMQQGTIRKAYQGLMEYMLELKGDFNKKYPGYFASGGMYYGYMDMTYFSLLPEPLKQRKLKVAIVFLHDTCRFEVWLAGINKQVQSKYWTSFKESGWTKYPLVPTIKGEDAIIQHVITDDPDFNDLQSLTRQIEAATETFIKDIEAVLPALL